MEAIDYCTFWRGEEYDGRFDYRAKISLYWLLCEGPFWVARLTIAKTACVGYKHQCRQLVVKMAYTTGVLAENRAYLARVFGCCQAAGRAIVVKKNKQKRILILRSVKIAGQPVLY